MSDLPTCCCADWIGGLARDQAARLAAIARHEGVPSADVLDVIQDAFQTLLARPDFELLRERPVDPAHVVAAITRNAARNARRKHHRTHEHVELDEADLAAATPLPDAALELTTATEQLAGCMRKLGDVQRHVVTLRVLEELSGAEAARELGLTPNHVAVLLHRAREELQSCMLAAS
ncbi:MAG: sigma-70 family RNA polymerase sigma factor [Kofleriaceae bacterium]